MWLITRRSKRYARDTRVGYIVRWGVAAGTDTLIITVGQGNLALTGTAPTITVQGSFVITVGQGNLALTGTAPTAVQTGATSRQQARLTVGRLNATRLGDYYPSAWIYLNSLLISRPGAAQGLVIDKSLTLGEAEADIPFTASFDVRAVVSPPQQGQAVYVSLGSADHRIFGGQVISCEQNQIRSHDKPTWKVRCEGNHRLLNRRLITARFTSADAGDIIRTLVTSWTTGFTANHVKGTLGSVDEIEFTRERPARAITRVIERVGGRWYLDAYNDVHTFVGSEPGISPTAALTTTGKHWNWQHERDISQSRTKVIVIGGGHATSQQHLRGTTTVFLDDSEYLTGVSTIAAGRYIYDVASVNRIAAPWFIVLSNSLSAGGLQEGLPAGTMANVYAVAQSTTYQNSVAAIEGGDGIHEYSMTDGRMTQSGALQRARAEIAVFGPIEHKGTYETRDPSARIGQPLILNADSPTHITSVTARIQRVTVSKFEDSTRSWNANRAHHFPQRAVTYSSAAVKDIAQILGEFERGGS